MSDFSPPVAFSFMVSFEGNADVGTHFQEVSGLESRLDVEPVTEGGENRFVHALPKPAKPSNLVLQRCVADIDDDLVTWCKSTLENDFSKPIQPRDLRIALIDKDKKPMAQWHVRNAYPVTLDVAGFDAMKSELAIEKIELAVSDLSRLD